MELLLALCLGIGLSAATGFRIFLPPLVAGLAGATGLVGLNESMQWLASPFALTAFGIAAVMETGAYLVPWVGNVLDRVATPLAVVAGTLLTASLLTDVGPELRWILAIVAGGGAAASTQLATTAARDVAAVSTAGIGGPFVSVGENVASVVTTLLALVVPVIVVGILIVLAVLFVRRMRAARAGT